MGLHASSSGPAMYDARQLDRMTNTEQVRMISNKVQIADVENLNA